MSVRGVSYGRCKKYWDDFEELYDTLELRYSDKLEGLPFPTYCTRRNHTKKVPTPSSHTAHTDGHCTRVRYAPRNLTYPAQEAVECNRKSLEALLVRSVTRDSHCSLSVTRASATCID